MEIILFIFILCLLLVGAMKYKEGMDNPLSITQDHQGDIQHIHKQLTSLTITEESLKELLDKANTQSAQIYKLQISIPDGQVKKYS